MADSNFIPTTSRGAEMGGLLGSALGSGLSALVKHKLTQLTTRNTAKKIEKAGYTAEQADLLANTQNPIERIMYLKKLTPSLNPKDLVSIMSGTNSPKQNPSKQDPYKMAKIQADIVNSVLKDTPKLTRIQKVLKKYNFKDDDIKLVSGAKELTPDIVDIFLRYANNDPKKARAMAKKAGLGV